MRKAEPIAGLGGLLLLVSLSLPWYDQGLYLLTVGSNGTRTKSAVVSGTVTAWQVFSVIDIVLALLAVLMLAVPIVSLSTKGPAKSIGTALLASAFGWIAIPLVVFRLIDDGHHTLQYGAWVALVAAILGWLGSWFSLKDESTPGAVVPDIPRLPAPPTEAA